MSKIKSKMIRTLSLTAVLVIAGCGYSDYPGHPGHKTQNEAYVPSMSTVISGFGDEYDGTYVYSVKYNNRNWMSDDFNFSVKITSYKNNVTDSYPHRPNIFPDADGFNRATGFSGGEFAKYWIANDTDANSEGGLANFDQSQPLDSDGNWIAPGLILVMNEPAQEVDSVDWDLQSTAQSATQILSQLIQNGGKLDQLNLSIAALQINGVTHRVEPYQLGFQANTAGHSQVTLTNQKSVKSVLNTIIQNTENMKKVDLKLHFQNGMVVGLPQSMSIMFNHNVLAKLAK
ncbi:hypothetical protein ACUR5C_03090 [Aliikangiella sp. IMCC44653]